MHKPIPKECRNYLTIDPKTGNIFNSKGVQMKGTLRNGYTFIKVEGSLFNASRLAWFLYYDVDPGETTVDHINRIRTDNSQTNLRLATSTDQNRNKPFLGYIYKAKSNCFQARLSINNKRINLGTFDCPLLARLAFTDAAKEHYGEFYCDSTEGLDIAGRPEGIAARGPWGTNVLGYKQTKSGEKFEVKVNSDYIGTYECPLVARYAYLDALSSLGQSFLPPLTPTCEIKGRRFKALSDNFS